DAQLLHATLRAGGTSRKSQVCGICRCWRKGESIQSSAQLTTVREIPVLSTALLARRCRGRQDLPQGRWRKSLLSSLPEPEEICLRERVNCCSSANIWFLHEPKKPPNSHRKAAGDPEFSLRIFSKDCTGSVSPHSSPKKNKKRTQEF
ncbi:hypothetical protein KIL84_010344, partial [Mauremys mutica]